MALDKAPEDIQFFVKGACDVVLFKVLWRCYVAQAGAGLMYANVDRTFET